MNITGYTQMMEKGMNNPDCAFFVGSTMGQWIALKYLILLVIFTILYKLVGNVTQLAWDNMIRYVKKKIEKLRDERCQKRLKSCHLMMM